MAVEACINTEVIPPELIGIDKISKEIETLKTQMEDNSAEQTRMQGIIDELKESQAIDLNPQI